MGRSPCCSREGLNKGAWTPLEDKTLTDFITTHGEGKWRSLPKRAGLKRCGKSCRLRWLNYLRPDIKRGNITPDEEDLIIRLHKLLGNRWSLIAGRLPGRTDNEIKNYWNTNIGRRILFQADNKSNSNNGINHPPLIQSESTNKNSSSSSSSAVRSKASRCSKTFINSEQQQQQQQLDSTATASPKAVEAAAPPPLSDDLNPLHPQPPTITTPDDIQNFDFHGSMANDDFFMTDNNDNFLSNLFDNELFLPPPFSPPPRFDYNATIGHNSSINAFDTEDSSSNPCGVHTHESFDGMFHSAELGSMNMMSLFDTTCTTNLDWIQD